MSNILFDALQQFAGWLYDNTIGKIIELFIMIMEKVLFWGVPELPSQDIQTQWSIIVSILALCAILYAGFYCVFKEKEELEFNFRKLFLGFLLMKSGFQIFRDAEMVATAAVTSMLSTFDNPVSAFFQLLAGGAVALLVAIGPIIIWIIGIAVQIFIGLIGGYLLTIAGIYYIIPLVSIQEKGDGVIKLLVADLGMAVFNAGILMLTLFASSGQGWDIISRFIIALGYIVVSIIGMYKIIAWGTDNSGYERSDALHLVLVPDWEKVGKFRKKFGRRTPP